MTGVGVSTQASQANSARVGRADHQKWLEHRFVAHQMRRRGQPTDQIASHLKVAKRSVFRYLALPCPDIEIEPEVELADFYQWGKCSSNSDLDWFSTDRPAQRQAKEVCDECPVKKACRTYGLNKGLKLDGIWGGMGKKQRQREARRIRDGARGQQRGVA